MKSRLKWHRVTKELVCSCANEKCTNCDGKGYVGDEAGGYTVCSCATLGFRREYAGRVRPRSQRIGHRDVQWLEYRDFVAVPA